MKSFILLLLVTLSASKKRNVLYQVYEEFEPENCINDNDVAQAYRTGVDDMTIKLYKEAATRGHYFFVISPYSVWITLAAVAEGVDPETQRELFKFLSLPEDICSRKKIYRIAASRISSNQYVVSFAYTRTLVVDEGSTVNLEWYNLVTQQSLLQVISAPIKRNPIATASIIKQVVSPRIRTLNLNGYAGLFDSIDFSGLWTTAFAGAEVERAPFYSTTGEQIGSVDLMKMKKRVRIGYVPNINAKMVELPVGNGEYSIIIALTVTTKNVEPSVISLTNNTVAEVVQSLEDSLIPIEIAIPRFVIDSEVDMRELLEDLGVKSLWKNTEWNRYTSNPVVQPSSYIQRASVTFDINGINPPPLTHIYEPMKDYNELRRFIADGPFMFGVFETKTYSCLIATLFSKPTYPSAS